MSSTIDVLEQAAKVIEPYISSDFRRADRAMGAAEDLRRGGVLAGCAYPPSLPAREAAVNLLQCRFSWTDAEKIAAELAVANLLAN